MFPAKDLRFKRAKLNVSKIICQILATGCSRLGIQIKINKFPNLFGNPFRKMDYFLSITYHERC